MDPRHARSTAPTPLAGVPVEDQTRRSQSGRFARGSESDLTHPDPAPTLPPWELTFPGEPMLPVGSRVGEFCIDGVLGKGGFGEVYRASHPVIGKLVAIKVLARQFSVDPVIMSRFVDEARAVNQIRHRNIIDIFSFGQLADGRLYYVMEFLDGETLDQRISRGRLPLVDALPILRGIARALDAAHAAGITHRDLKAENVFLAQTDDGPLAKLFDFGIAKLTGRDEGALPKYKTRTGSPLGTVYYMSPEQTRGKNVDHRTDYYAFGVLAYRMLTGEFPIDGDDYMDILMKQVFDVPPPASDHVPELPEHVDLALAWLMQKDPARRPASLRAAVCALEGTRRDSEGFEVVSAELVMPAGIRVAKRAPDRRWLVAIACGLTLGAGGIAAVELLKPAAAHVDPIAGVWNEAQKRVVHAAFVATHKPYAETSYRSVERTFDHYAKEWRAMYAESASPLRRDCLQWRLDALRARIELFASADAAVVERAVDVAASLPELSACANPTAPVRAAADPVKLGELRQRLATASALEGVAKYSEAIALVEPVTREAVALADRALEADAFYALGELQAAAGEIDAAAESYDKAIIAATAGRHDEVVARASIRLAYVVGVEKARLRGAEGRANDGRALMQHAQAAIERLGGSRRLEAMLAVSRSVLLRKQGQYDESLAESARAIALGEAELGPTHPTVGRWINSHGLTLIERGNYAEARVHLERARVIAEHERGEAHPGVGFGYGNLGLERYRSGEYRQAIVLGMRALAILEPALGETSPKLVAPLILVADAHVELREHAEARPIVERALAILAGAKQMRTPTYASALATLGAIDLETGRAAAAATQLRQAIRLLELAKSPPLLLAHARFLLARALHATGNTRGAKDLVPVIRSGLAGTDELAKLDAWVAKLSRTPKFTRR
jgi:tetratricopeptide (TPR) repeat protein/tRNA A-37 threonylcarbamoyl transferase component Bud32